MVHSSRCPKHARRMPARYGLAVVAIGIGIAGANGHAVAWADPDSSGPSSSQSNAGTDHGPKKPAKGPGTRHSLPSGTDTPTDPSPAVQPNSSAPQADSITGRFIGKLRIATQAAPVRTGGTRSTKPDWSPRAIEKRLTAIAPSTVNGAAEADSATAPASNPTQPDPAAVTPIAPKIAAKAIPVTAKVAAVTTTSTTTTTPNPPEPLSPIAKIAALPGRIVNTVLQVLDITVSANGPKSPLNFAPINDALFAVFREVENTLGLTKTPAVQQVPPTLIYTGPTTGKTPTVSQFLNAATAEYVLGGTPGGLKPFTVNGKQMQYTNVLSGAAGKAWVTPEGQVIIAYQGTTGGTNLLFNPLIAISQVIADTQVIFTDTTPQAFTDSLFFAQQVRAAALEQGYSKDDIFVTGHSLGGWEAEYVAQQTGMGGIGFESPGLNTKVPGNGANSGFVNIETYGDSAAYFSTDLPGLQPFMPAYVPGGGSKPHYGSIVMIGDPNATTPLINASALWGTGLIGDVIFMVDMLGNFFAHHLPGMQAYHLGITPDPGVVPWLGVPKGPVNAGYGDMTIPELLKAASDAGTLFVP
ncbi:hypothetical protein M2272_002148 [Mycobacterium frederiksbergense]|uniref:PE-PPE domain-containing protein n=1 Tax=Mycolicibacterium frederiksbergense TaxID=117567 RepID=A0ABT6KXR7_9MYCO|nr:hypothetical protein [Mycolicibacterium frederiksbergense]MDH6195508.1 hypothetical protein [Mycolicibacterium frederiksbergense]